MRVVLASLFALSCQGSCAPAVDEAAVEGARFAGRPNILVIDLDTLRADRIGRVRDGASITPEIDALALRGTRFDTMVAQSGWTLPSLTALLTGKNPLTALARGSVRDVSWLPAETRTIQDILGLYDYATAVFYGATLPNGFPQFKVGFQHAEPPQKVDPDGDASRQFLAWLDDEPKEPWFALVHTADLHLLGEVPRKARDRFAPGHPDPCIESKHLNYAEVVDEWAKGVGKDAAEELLRAHYDGAVAHYDAHVGTMVEGIERRGLGTRTVVIVTSDHGQELFEHGQFDHGPPYEFLIRVPLVVFDPTRDQAHVPVETSVQTIDLAPTILDIAKVPRDEEMEGLSFVPLLEGRDGYTERPAFGIADPHRIALRGDTYHLLACASAGCPAGGMAGRRKGDRGVVYELYDHRSDPGEHTNLWGTGVPEEQALTEALEAFRARGPHAEPSRDGLTAAQQKVLRERGYWDVDGDGSGSGSGSGP